MTTWIPASVQGHDKSVGTCRRGVARGQWQQVDHRPLLKGLPDDRCQCPHWGYVFRGELTFHYADHDEVHHEGDAFYAPAGHVPVHTEPGSEYLQISPSDELRRTSEVIMKNVTAQRPQD
ncbi:hypothetical protein OHT68_06880 [Streptomyces canus]|uniref:hypothetical protein n=1 Tax=Streptomyces canus TaxID=58343 RepID=UPI002E27B78A|nr:hypothetical protein [Streptomyces canus]